MRAEAAKKMHLIFFARKTTAFVANLQASFTFLIMFMGLVGLTLPLRLIMNILKGVCRAKK